MPSKEMSDLVDRVENRRQSHIDCPYDSDYFLRGKQTGKSLYEDYRWLPNLTIPMVCAMVGHLGIEPDDTILDFGCARGYVVKALRLEGYLAYGTDLSEWAIENADVDTRPFLRWTDNDPPVPSVFNSIDWVIAKDVLEHVVSVPYVVESLMGARKGIFAVVPLAHGKMYDVPDYERDATHVHRRPLDWWVNWFHQPGWSVEARYRVPGIKDNYAQYPTGNGFITARRIS